MNMSKGEKAVLSCPREYATGGTLLPAPPDDAERIEFELQLLSLIQVYTAAALCRLVRWEGRTTLDCSSTTSTMFACRRTIFA